MVNIKLVTVYWWFKSNVLYRNPLFIQTSHQTRQLTRLTKCPLTSFAQLHILREREPRPIQHYRSHERAGILHKTTGNYTRILIFVQQLMIQCKLYIVTKKSMLTLAFVSISNKLCTVETSWSCSQLGFPCEL